MKIILIALGVCLITSCGVENLSSDEESERKSICLSDIDNKERDPIKVIDPNCFSKSSLCPIYPEMNKKHRLVLVDTTGGLTEPEVSYLKGDVFDLKTLTNDIEPYSRVSVIDLNDKFDPVGVIPLASFCRPQRGVVGTPFGADVPHKSQGQGFVKRQFKGWAKKIWGTHLKLKDTSPAKQTLLFEHINSVTTVSKFKFREEDYKDRTLILFSDLLQNSKERFPFTPRRIKKYSDFETFYNKASLKDKKYLDEIKPSFSSNSKVVIYHIINENVRKSDLEFKLKTFWLGFFKWSGVATENIEYIRLVDNSKS